MRGRGGVVVTTVLMAASLLLAGPGEAAAGSGGPPPVSPVDGRPRTAAVADLSPLLVTAREPAVPFAGSTGKVVVTYELGLENATPFTLTPTSAEVLTPSGRVLQRLDRAAVAANVALAGKRGGVTELGGSQAATLYVTLEFARRGDVPQQLLNRVTFAGLPGGATATSDPVAVPVSRLTAPVLGPPLEPGSGYVAADSCCDSPRHRRALLAIGNGLWLAQRFAVDWEQLDAAHRTVTRGNPADPAAYTIYGKRVVAAAAGVVVHVIDGLPDQKPGELPASTAPVEADGNSIVVDIGGGLYTLYAHMRAGSIAVHEGQRIARGQLIGLVGNSGNTSAPHLHFHVMDGPSPLTSEGVPYVIDSFTTAGRITSTAAFDELENTTRPLPVVALPNDGRHTDQMPLDLDLVTFAGR